MILLVRQKKSVDTNDALRAMKKVPMSGANDDNEFWTLPKEIVWGVRDVEELYIHSAKFSYDRTECGHFAGMEVRIY